MRTRKFTLEQMVHIARQGDSVGAGGPVNSYWECLTFLDKFCPAMRT